MNKNRINTMMTNTEALKLAIDAAAEERERLESTALFGGWVDYLYTAPDEDGRYLVWVGDMVTGANYENGQFWPDACDEETITHWAKISPPRYEA